MTLVCPDHFSTKTWECMATMLLLIYCAAGLLIMVLPIFAKKDDTLSKQ